ncbi:hypothetical protein E2C01_092577 [Portunus trituberculatus]|uniref:Uncharacterized protein n=1 Tax=Portunus trituberculatus TaxID=210409 RepID=A0A5B7JMC8_PORTR|nr:hypothetical protein [Portunus trituberculatus]
MVAQVQLNVARR